MKITALKLIISFSLIIALNHVWAQAVEDTVQQDPKYKVDNRIKSQLDSMEYKYTISKNGDFKLICKIGDERTQVVFINSGTQVYQGIEIREVFSPMAVFKANDMTVAFLKKLLEENYNKKLGAWQMISGDDSSLITFTVKTDANCTSEDLNKIIWLVAQTADELEKEISTDDNF